MRDQPHEIANVLKEILRESNESVCPPELFDAFLSITIESHPEEFSRAELLADLMRKLPPTRMHLFLLIIVFMKTVVLFEDTNKMGDQNISMMFAPNMFRNPKNSPLQEISYLGVKNDLLKVMMNYLNTVFDQTLVFKMLS